MLLWFLLFGNDVLVKSMFGDIYWVWVLLCCLGAINTKFVCRCLCFATVRCGPCCVWGRRCPTHVASLSTCDTTCPSYARLTHNCVFKNFNAVRQHPRTLEMGCCARVGGDLWATKLFFLEFIVPNDFFQKKTKMLTFELPMLTFELPFFFFENARFCRNKRLR